MPKQASLDAKEIYDKLCPKCKGAFEKLLAERISQEVVKGLLKDKKGG